MMSYDPAYDYDPEGPLPECECGYQPAEGRLLAISLPRQDGERMTYECPSCCIAVPFGDLAFGEDVDEFARWFASEAKTVNLSDTDVTPEQAAFLSQFIDDKDA